MVLIQQAVSHVVRVPDLTIKASIPITPQVLPAGISATVSVLFPGSKLGPKILTF